MPKPHHATAGHSATPNSKPPTGGHQRPPSDSRGTVEAGDADSAPAIIVFGANATGKPTAATFPADQADLATKAAGLMQLRVLKVDRPELAQFAAQLPVGKIYASGHGFVPPVRPYLYDRLNQLADPKPAPGLPRTWDDIDVGHLVLALDEPCNGWWEAIVLARDGDMLTLKWRDYPNEGSAGIRHRAAVALLKAAPANA
jgi:hypothetical protein